MVREHGVEVRSDEARLHGTLALPADAGAAAGVPALLLVAGSGKIDRDGTVVDLGIALNVYRDLAGHATELGFATLRYDKRGVGGSEGDPLRTGMWDLVADIGAWVGFLKAHPAIDPERIYLLGHSEGCMLITAYAARHPVAGLILLAGGGETMGEATARQRQIAYGELKAQAGLQGWLARTLRVDQLGERQSAKLMARMCNTDKDVIRVQFRPLNAKWFREHLQYDLLADLTRLECPVLAVTGSSDLQADPAKLTRLQQLAAGNVRAKVIEGMDHGLKQDAGGSLLRIKEVLRRAATQPLHPELVRVLDEWLGEQRSAIA